MMLGVPTALFAAARGASQGTDTHTGQVSRAMERTWVLSCDVRPNSLTWEPTCPLGEAPQGVGFLVTHSQKQPC